MTIEQTVEVPASRRVTFDLPPSFPIGTAKVALVVFPEAAPESPRVRTRMTAREAIEVSRGIAKRLGATVTVDSFLEHRHEETKREEAEYRRRHPESKA